MAEATTAVRQELEVAAKALGFVLCAVAPATEPLTFAHFETWLAKGFAGKMTYLEGRREAYSHPRSILPTVRSVIMLGASYKGVHPPATQPGSGRVASYATSGHDYHDVLRDRLKQLAKVLQRLVPGCRTRGVVDTAPLLERDFARLAGLGWFGKNTMLIHKRAGSFLFLAGLLTDAELPADSPHSTSHCGTCTRCLEACPTQAFPEPGVLDATRCISYLTIELRESIPEALRPGIGDWIFGCDICQDVCPWNTKPKPAEDVAFQPTATLQSIDAMALLAMTAEEFQRTYGNTPLARPGYGPMLRNAMIVLANQRFAPALPQIAAFREHSSTMLRETAEWCVRQFALAASAGEA